MFPNICLTLHTEIHDKNQQDTINQNYGQLKGYYTIHLKFPTEINTIRSVALFRFPKSAFLTLKISLYSRVWHEHFGGFFHASKEACVRFGYTGEIDQWQSRKLWGAFHLVKNFYNQKEISSKQLKCFLKDDTIFYHHTNRKSLHSFIRPMQNCPVSNVYLTRLFL